MANKKTNSETPGEAPVQLRPFERSLPMALLRAREAAMRQFRPMLKAHDLTDQQWRVLRALTTENCVMTVGELVSATFLLGPSLTRILSNLGTRGLIDRTVPEHDQRQGVISLTTDGQELVSTVAPHSESTYDAIENGFGHQKMADLMNLLQELANLEFVEDDGQRTVTQNKNGTSR